MKRMYVLSGGFIFIYMQSSFVVFPANVHDSTGIRYLIIAYTAGQILFSFLMLG
jgi:hypothetical protein